MNHKAMRTIEKYNMLSGGESVAVALSGGADSVALLDFLCSLRERLGLLVLACHINHCLRGAESDRDERFVRELCKKYEVKLYCFTEDIPALCALSGRSVEEEARERRYLRFAGLAEKERCKIATAHTLSDNAETVLFRLARGTGTAGLCGIPPVRGLIIRPLLEVSRGEVEEYCKARALDFVTDSTNLEDDCARNIIRHYVMPRLLEINAGAERNIAALCETTSIEQNFLAVRARAAIERSDKGGGFYLSQPILREHPAVRAVALKMLLAARATRGNAAPRARITELLAAMEGRGETFQLSKDEYVRVTPEHILFTDRKGDERCFLEYPVKVGTIAQFNDKTVSFLHLDYEYFKNNENNYKTPLKNVVDYDKMSLNAILRTRREGDRFSHPTRGWSKTLKKLFCESHIPAREREQLLVCADTRGVLWVEGFGASRAVAPDDMTKEVLVIKIAKG